MFLRAHCKRIQRLAVTQLLAVVDTGCPWQRLMYICTIHACTFNTFNTL